MASGGASPQAPPTTSRDFVCGDERGGEGRENGSRRAFKSLDMRGRLHSDLALSR
jgi:hypothetical protein